MPRPVRRDLVRSHNSTASFRILIHATLYSRETSTIQYVGVVVQILLKLSMVVNIGHECVCVFSHEQRGVGLDLAYTQLARCH